MFLKGFIFSSGSREAGTDGLIEIERAMILIRTILDMQQVAVKSVLLLLKVDLYYLFI